jgi:hypothetical protein
LWFPGCCRVKRRRSIDDGVFEGIDEEFVRFDDGIEVFDRNPKQSRESQEEEMENDEDNGDDDDEAITGADVIRMLEKIKFF